MSLSKYHILDVPSMKTSDTSLSCLPSLPPHPICMPTTPASNQPTPEPPSQGPTSTVPIAAAPAHPSSSYPESAVSTPPCPYILSSFTDEDVLLKYSHKINELLSTVRMILLTWFDHLGESLSKRKFSLTI